MTGQSDGVYTISVDGREVSINTSDDGKKNSDQRPEFFDSVERTNLALSLKYRAGQKRW